MPHIHEVYDYTIAVYIVSPSGKVLLVSHPKYGLWLPVGGHIELDEDPEEALYREIREEVGIEVEPLTNKPAIESPGTKFIPTPNFVDVHEANPPHKHIAFIYFVRAKDEATALSNEHDTLKWFAADELVNETYALKPDILFYASEAIKLLG